MATMGIDGLVSGLDTTALITQLMQVESAPQALLKTKQTATTNLVTALQSLNTKVSSLKDAATKAATPASWAVTKATASATSVTATTSATSTPTELTFRVDQLAASQVSRTQAGWAIPTTGSLTFDMNGTRTEVAVGADAASTARAITQSAAGVNAVVVTANGETRLQLTSKETGQAHAFTVYEGTKAQVAAGTATAVTLDGARAAADAKVTLWPGPLPGDGTQVSSPSNTFTDVLAGTTVTVSKVEADPVTVSIVSDTAAVTSLASGLVGALGVVFSEISSRTAKSTTTADDGRTVVSGGLFTGDSAVRALQQQLQSAASYPVDGTSPTEVGIVIGKDGSFTFDQTKFAAALAKDPDKVQKVVSGLAQRVADVAENASDKVDGTLTLKITGQQDLVKNLGTQIEDWDRRLAVRKESLQRTYSALEVTLSNLNSQSSWLAGQLSSLSASSS